MATTELAPLPTLLSRVLGHLAAELEEAAGVGPTVPSLAVWSNVLRCVAAAGSDGLEERALPKEARISRRLATAAVAGAARRGWVSAEPGRGGGKSRQVHLSDLGEAAARLWPPKLATVDAECEGSPLRAVLEQIVGRVAFELPHFPASYGAADPSAVGGPFVSRSTKADGSPVHGKDWAPVPRVDDDTVSSLPVTALLSQALMAFTVDYESRFPWPLASTATVLCHLGVEPRPVADVPGDHGITGNGKSLLERHLIATVTRDPAHPRNRLVALTERGVAVMQHHPARLEAVEHEWRDRFGSALIADLREALLPVAHLAQSQPDHVIAPLHTG